MIVTEKQKELDLVIYSGIFWISQPRWNSGINIKKAIYNTISQGTRYPDHLSEKQGPDLSLRRVKKKKREKKKREKKEKKREKIDLKMYKKDMMDDSVKKREKKKKKEILQSM